MNFLGEKSEVIESSFESEVMSSNSAMDENSMEYWREKCTKLERVIKTLSTHCVRVVEKHEDLLEKFKRNEDQYKKLKLKFLEKGEQIKKARDVLIPVSNELKTLREKYEIAVECQMEAESFAVKTTSKNKELKRQSHMLFQNMGKMSVVDLNITDLDQEDEEEKKYREKLGQKIDELEEQKSGFSVQVQELTEILEMEKESNDHLREKFELMKEELRQAKTAIKQQEGLLQQVANTSEKAFMEYEAIEQTYQKEVIVRNEAERFAKRLCTERDQARRESAMALSKVADNKKLMDAMLEIQELNAKSAEMKDEYDRKIAELENQLKAAKEVYSVENLETENEGLNEERNSLQERLEKSETEVKTLHAKYSDLMEKYKTVEAKYEKITRIPIPPPPPPPPVQKSGGFLQKLVGRKGQREKAKEQLKKGLVRDDNHSKAVDEMMERIRSGNIGLRPVSQKRSAMRKQSLPEQEEPSAMIELQGLLTKMRKSQSEDDLSVFGDSGVEEGSELGKILKKRLQASQDKEPPTPQKVISPRPVPAPRKLSIIADEAEEES